MPTGTPKISIGLPVYNGENYLAETIESILNQSYGNFELIICDNASTDSTPAIIASYAAKDVRIRVNRSEVNVGAARNFNWTFELARGAYFKWSAHDDLIAPTFLERCLDVMEHDPGVAICYSTSVVIDGNGRKTANYADGLHLKQPRPEVRFRHFLGNQGMCHPVFGLVPTSIMRQSGLIGNYPRSDRNLIGELLLYGTIHELQEDLFIRRIHPEISTEVNKSETDLASWFDPLKKGKTVFPRWRRLKEYMIAINRAPIDARAKRGCYWEIFKLATATERWLGFFDDVRTAAGTAVLQRGK